MEGLKQRSFLSNMKNFLGVLTVMVAILGIAMDGYNCKVVQFIFGDSLSDVGNNKYLGRSLAQASLPWYGIDFGNGLPNGRFTNGRTVADIIGTPCLHIASIHLQVFLYIMSHACSVLVVHFNVPVRPITS